MTSKIFYTLDEVSKITRLPSLLIRQYISMKKRAISPELLPDINPKYIKGEPVFTRKDIDALLRFIDKRNDESWERWHLRLVKETIAKRELKKEKKPPRRPDLRIIKGKKKDCENT